MANYSDNFNRASLGTDWTAINGGTWSIASSTYLQQDFATGIYRGLRYNNVLDSDDVDVSVRCYSNSGSTGAGILVRAPNSGTAQTDLDGYAIIFFPGDTFYLLRFDNGNDGGQGYSYTYGTPATNTYYTLRITVQGSTVTGYIDGTQRFQFTDTTYSGSGNRSVALLSYAPTPRYDDFSAQDIVSSQTVTPSLFTNTNTFYTYTISNANGAQSVSLDLLENTNFFYDSTLSVVQSVSLNTANKNRYSLRFNGNGADVNRVRIPLENGSIQYPVNVGAGSFTVETWIKAQYSENTTTSLDEDARYSNIFYDRDSWGEQRGHVIGVTRSGANLVATFGQAGSGGTWTSISTTSDIGDNEWHHVAVVRNIANGNVRIFIDGIQEASGTYDTTNWSFPVGHTVGSGQDNQNLILGCEKHDVGYYFTGELDELRISNSVKYASTFQPARYLAVDGDTVALFNFDEGSGTSTVDVAESQIGTLLVGGSPSGPTWNALELATSTVFPVIVTSAFNIIPNILENTNTFFANTFSAGSVSISFDVLESADDVFNVVVEPQPITISTDLIESVTTLFDLTLNVGAVSVNASLLQNENNFFGFIVSAGGNAITPDLINSSNQLFQITTSPGTVTVIPAFVASENYLLDPTINQNINPGFISNESVLFDISIGVGSVSVLPEVILSEAQIFQLTFWSGNSVFPDLLTNTTTLFSPTISSGAVTVTFDFLENSSVLFQPLVSSGSTIFINQHEAESIVFDVDVLPGDVTVVFDAETNQNTVYDIFITGDNDVALDVLANQENFFNFSVAQNVSPVFIDSENLIYEFTISSQNNPVLEIIENQNTFYQSTITTGSVAITPNVIESTLIYEPSFYIGDDRDVLLDFLTNQNVFFTSTLLGLSEERIIRTSVQNRIIVVK